MSNYTKSTNFATKDTLAAGNALKRVKGTEIDDEFNALSTAIATKANINNTALTGVPTTPTAITSTNSTQIASTAFTKAAITDAVDAIPTVTLGINGVNVNGSNVTGRTLYVNNSGPNGGSNGDIWFEY